MKLTHLDTKGQAHMVDVTDKAESQRIATAYSFVRMLPTTLAMVQQGNATKGDVLATARIAGIMAAKQTPHLIPMCHPLLLSSVKVEFELLDTEQHCGIAITATCTLNGKTGVEMEALTAASIAALTIYDMCKSVEKGMRIEQTALLHKSGGKSGDWNAPKLR